MSINLIDLDNESFSSSDSETSSFLAWQRQVERDNFYKVLQKKLCARDVEGEGIIKTSNFFYLCQQDGTDIAHWDGLISIQDNNGKETLYFIDYNGSHFVEEFYYHYLLTKNLLASLKPFCCWDENDMYYPEKQIKRDESSFKFYHQCNWLSVHAYAKVVPVCADYRKISPEIKKALAFIPNIEFFEPI